VFRKIAKWFGIGIVVLLLALGGFLLRNRRTPSPTDLSKSVQLASPPAVLKNAVTLKVVTYNVHDLYVASDHRPERMRGIADALVALDPDIVGFQESFIAGDRALLIAGLEKSRLKHHQYFPSASVGSGLLISSAWPIEEYFFFRYTKGGMWYRINHGDWWAGKGIALARIALPDGNGFIDFFDTHAHAGYGFRPYDAIRLSNMMEVPPFIDRAAVKTSPAIIAGDFNCREKSEQYAALKVGNVLDRMLPENTGPDHIFAVKNAKYTFELLDSKTIEGTVPIEGGTSELSDHAGYMATIRITPIAAK
jgi:endonuclease/exonuclease/phosphatase family metal-dependent hydrolase